MSHVQHKEGAAACAALEAVGRVRHRWCDLRVEKVVFWRIRWGGGSFGSEILLLRRTAILLLAFGGGGGWRPLHCCLQRRRVLACRHLPLTPPSGGGGAPHPLVPPPSPCLAYAYLPHPLPVPSEVVPADTPDGPYFAAPWRAHMGERGEGGRGCKERKRISRSNRPPHRRSGEGGSAKGL